MIIQIHSTLSFLLVSFLVVHGSGVNADSLFRAPISSKLYVESSHTTCSEGADLTFLLDYPYKKVHSISQ